MATDSPNPNNEVDPVKAVRRAVEEIRDAIKGQINLSTGIARSPSYTGSLAREQQLTTAAGPGALLGPPISQAAPDNELAEKAGELGSHRSEGGEGGGRGVRTRAAFSEHRAGSKRTWQQMNDEEQAAWVQKNQPEGLEKKTGLGVEQIYESANDPLYMPQYKWRLDEVLRNARDVAIKTATSTKLPEQIRPTMEGLAGALNTGYEYAAPYEKGGDFLKKITNAQFANAQVGTQLGYSPQTGALGAYIAGVPNPLAAFTSEAGKQGLGQKLGALGAMFSGGISLAQAEGLRGALSEQGFSNQQKGNILGAYTGGENESLSQALEPLVKEGVPASQAAVFAESTRYGNTSIRSLRASLHDMGSTAKTLKLTIDETAESMQRYAKEQEKEGAKQVESIQHYKEIAGATGILPTKIAELNQSEIGTVTGQAHGFFPGTIGAQSGEAQAKNAIQTVERIMAMTPGGKHETWVTNSKGERHLSATSQRNQLATAVAMHLLPGDDLEVAEHLIKNKAAIERGVQNAAKTQALVENSEHTGARGTIEWMAAKGHHDEVRKMQQLTAQIHGSSASYSTWKQKTENEWAEQGGQNTGYASAQEYVEYKEGERPQYSKTKKQREKLEEMKEHAKNAGTAEYERHVLQPALTKAKKESGLSTEELEKVEHENKGKDMNQKFMNLQKAEEAHQKIITGEEEGKGIIELSPRAKEFFKLHLPPEFAEKARAGGESTAQQAAQPNYESNPWAGVEKKLLEGSPVQ